MSANLIVDLTNTTDFPTSITAVSGATAIIGRIVDLVNADTFCNVWVATPGGVSGELAINIQTSDATTSGSFTDPTSGLIAATMPVNIASGGIFMANSGLWASGNQSPQSPLADGSLLCSGGIVFAGFQRPGRYARLNALSGAPNAVMAAGFITQKRTTGSGGGYSPSPGSGTVSV